MIDRTSFGSALKGNGFNNPFSSRSLLISFFTFSKLSSAILSFKSDSSSAYSSRLPKSISLLYLNNKMDGIIANTTNQITNQIKLGRLLST